MEAERENATPRRKLASRLGGQLPSLLSRAERHQPAALRQLAELRKGVGSGRGAPFGGFPVFVELVGADLQEELMGLEDYERQQLLADALLVTSLVAWSRVPVARPAKGRRSFGADFKLLTHEKEEAAERAFKALLSSSRDGIDYHLRRAFSLLASEGLSVDAAALINDLGYWDAEGDFVKRRWAEDFWLGRRKQDSEEEAETEEAAK